MIKTTFSELSKTQNSMMPAIRKIAGLEGIDPKLKCDIAKVCREFKKAIMVMSSDFQTEVLAKYQDGVDENGQPKIKEGQEDAFQQAQIDFGKTEIALECNPLNSELLLSLDKVTAADVEGLLYLTDFQ